LKPFFGFSDAGWFVLLIQADMSIDSWHRMDYATQHANHQVSLSLLGQAVLTSVLAWFFDEKITLI
jgi:hypothetical protein